MKRLMFAVTWRLNVLAHDCCYESLRERERLEERIRQAKTEKACFELARDTYRFIEAYPERAKAFENKRITIVVPKPVKEAKE
jgi:hypothetical protein